MGRLSIAAAGITEASVRRLLRVGYNEGDWDGVAGFTSRWATSARGRAVGYATGTSSITIAYAAPGDVNLDGVVDIIDMSSFAFNATASDLSTADWAAGDFNYDDTLDQLDIATFLGAALYDSGGYLTPAEAAFAVLASP